MALVDRSVDCCDGVRHQKLKNMGSDLGGAVKGFKDGMKEGGQTAEEKAAAAPGQVTNAQAADKTTIDVEAKQKS